MRGSAALPVSVLLVAGVLAASGCSAWQAARLYESGSLALEQGETTRALEDLSAAAVLAPEAADVHNQLGLAHLAAGDDAGALRSFERAVSLGCDDPVAQHNLARLAAKLQREAAIAAIGSPNPSRAANETDEPAHPGDGP